MATDLTVGGFYAVIPALVLKDPHLRPRTKLLYGEIVRLASAYGYCYAKNNFLLDVCTYIDGETGAATTISERTLQSMLAELRQYGYIRMDTGPIPGRDGEMGRRIFVGQALASEPADPAENRGAENFTPYLFTPNKRTNTPIVPKDVWEWVAEYAGEDGELRDAIWGLLENRAAIKKLVKTMRSMNGVLRDVDKLSDGKRDLKILLLEQAVKYNWLTVYPLKRDVLPSGSRAVPGEAEDRGHCVCAYSGELPKEQFREWAYLQAAGPEHVVYRQDGATGKNLAVSDPMMDKLISQWMDERFWLFDLERNTRHDPQTILSQFEYAKMRYNCDVFLVDNIMSVDMDGFSDREFNRAQSKFTQMLSTFSKRRGVHTHLVVHPRKSTSGSNEKITSDDVSGSGDITNRADNVFFLTIHNVDGASKPLLQVLKNRDFGSHRHQWLDFDTKSRRFFQDQTGDPKRPYGWDLNARQLTLEEMASSPEIDAIFPEGGK